MSSAEQNYEIYNKELLAIIDALKTWRHFLMDTKDPFEIWTDHRNLTYYQEPQTISPRVARWSHLLQDYNFTLKHISGKTNTKADILSRLPEYPDKLEQKESTILQEKHFKRLSRDDNLKEGTNRITIIEDDPIFIKTVEESAIPGTIKRKLKEDDNFKREGKLIYWKNRLYIPNKNLQIKIIKQHHDEPTAGHPGRLRTEEIIARNYWWPTIKKDIKEYIKGCESCQRNKII